MLICAFKVKKLYFHVKLSIGDIDKIKLIIYDKARGGNPGISPNQLEIAIYSLYNDSNLKLEGKHIVEVVIPDSKDKKVKEPYKSRKNSVCFRRLSNL